MKRPIQILHLEDNESDSLIVKRLLEKSKIEFVFKWVTDKNEYVQALFEFKPDIILSDHSLPSFNSVEALRILKASGINIPFILITGTVSEEFAVEMMKEGIEDYILKDRLQRLPSAVLNALEKAAAEENKKNHYLEIVSQEKRFRALIENSHEAIILCDSEFRNIYSSASNEKITGFTPEERLGKVFMESSFPEDRPILEKMQRDLLANPGVPLNAVFRTRHKTGKYIWIDMTVTNLLHDSNVGAFVSNFRDVTIKINAEKELERTGKHFRALIENISDAIILVDEQGFIKYHSPSVTRISGISFEDTKGKKIFDFLHPEDVMRGETFFATLNTHFDVPIHNSFRMKHKDGHYIWVEGTITNLLHDEAVKAFIINYRDISPRKMAEEQLQKSEANLRTIFDNTNIAYVLTDDKCRIVSYNNSAMLRYEYEFGVPLNEGALLTEYLQPERRSDADLRFKAVLNGKKINYEISFTHPDKTISWHSVNMFPVHDIKHTVFGMIVASEDITAKKIIDLERDKMTTDIVQHNKDLEQFAYIVSHNLRSPVANILGLSNVIKQKGGLSPADFKKCLDGLELSTRKLDDVITDLNFILQTRREINEQKQLVSFTGLINDIKTSISELLEKQDITIQTNFTVNKLFTIKSYLHSIFFNLITNSIKYRDPSIPTIIHISSKKKDNLIIIRFKDNGLGIDLAKHGSKLFGLYKKFHTHIEGKGMGLYMVKTQVEILGGRISVKSEVNQGTEFILEFSE